MSLRNIFTLTQKVLRSSLSYQKKRFNFCERKKWFRKDFSARESCHRSLWYKCYNCLTRRNVSTFVREKRIFRLERVVTVASGTNVTGIFSTSRFVRIFRRERHRSLWYKCYRNLLYFKTLTPTPRESCHRSLWYKCYRNLRQILLCVLLGRTIVLKSCEAT